MLKKFLPIFFCVAAVSLVSIFISVNSKMQNNSLTVSSKQVKDSQIENKNIIATVDGENINYSDFIKKKKIKEKMNDIASNLKTSEPDISYVINSSKSSTFVKESNSQFLQKCIKEQVIKNDCKKEKISVSKSEAKQALDEDYKIMQGLLKSSDSDERSQAEKSWNLYKSLIKGGTGLTLDEYTEQYGIEGMRTVMLEGKHYKWFASKHSSEGLNDKQMLSLYKQYVDTLEKNSNIKINQKLLNS